MLQSVTVCMGWQVEVWRAARAVRAMMAQASVQIGVVRAAIMMTGAMMMVVQVAQVAMSSVIVPVCLMSSYVVVRKVSHARMLLLPVACS